jgi:hypothetical protein
LLGEAVVGTASSTGAPRQTLRHHFRPVGTTGNSDFYVYNSHLKASDSSADAQRRFEDVQVIRDDADSLGQGAHIIYVGDFNLYRSTEAAYQEFLSAGNGQAFDPINRPGNWSGNSSFRDIFTQAPSANALPALGLDGGGLDDRLDFQLISGELRDGVGLDYRPNSYHTFGVNGSVAVNGSIDDASNTALPGLSNRLNVLGLLRTVSDHLPVVADYTFVLPSSNAAPTDIVLNGSTVVENVSSGTIVGTLSTTDPNAGDTFNYSLVPGVGSTDNARFSIVGNSLRTNGPIDFEMTPTLSIRLRSSDQGGLFFEEPFLINVANLNDASVLNRKIFYNRSSSSVFGNGSGNPISAIDNLKVALLPGQSASFANYTSVVNGINGLVVDIAGGGTISASDFRFDTWAGFPGNDFVAATAVPTITAYPGGGVSGSTRIKIEFANGSIRNTWLRVTVLANTSTDLANNDVFYFGNAVGDFGIGNTGNPIMVRTNSVDTAAVRQNESIAANSVSISNIYDVNKDGRVNSTDTSLVRQNQSLNVLRYFTAPTSLPRLAWAPIVVAPFDNSSKAAKPAEMTLATRTANSFFALTGNVPASSQVIPGFPKMEPMTLAADAKILTKPGAKSDGSFSNESTLATDLYFASFDRFR